MSSIEKIDKNFEVVKTFEKEGFVYYNILEKPFKIYGVIHEGDKFVRMPEDVAKTVNNGVYELYANNAGGRVRFKTNSKNVRIIAKLNNIGKMPHFALTGSAGFDMYSENDYIATFTPPYDIEESYESSKALRTNELQNITINFPTYSGVSELYIGLEEGCVLMEADDYKTLAPVVYYGSSITQGGCCSRPGNTYQAIITRMLNVDHVNLGFSGSARGEDEMAEYIKNLNMSVFVYDYDHNAPTVEHLKNTHERMFKIIRRAQPELPIVMVSMPNWSINGDARKEVIFSTYNNAKAAGDKNVYFIDGSKLFDIFGGDSCTVDGCHPNDLGFICMATGIAEVLKEII